MGAVRFPRMESPTCRVLTSRPQPGNQPKTQPPPLHWGCQKAKPPTPGPFPLQFPSGAATPPAFVPLAARGCGASWLAAGHLGAGWAWRAAALGPPRAALLVGQARRAEGAESLAHVGGKGTEGFGLWIVGLSF